MIQIYKNYEGHKELEELDHIELESWVMITDPTMISGLYGMNVNGVGMPFATKAYGFAAISIFSLIVCLIAVYILKKKHIL